MDVFNIQEVAGVLCQKKPSRVSKEAIFVGIKTGKEDDEYEIGSAWNIYLQSASFKMVSIPSGEALSRSLPMSE